MTERLPDPDILAALKNNPELYANIKEQIKEQLAVRTDILKQQAKREETALKREETALKLEEQQLRLDELPVTRARHDFILTILGNISALIAVAMISGVAIYLAQLGATTAAGSVMSTTVVGVSSVHVFGRKYAAPAPNPPGPPQQSAAKQ